MSNENDYNFDDLLKIDPNFIEENEKDSRLVYSDTDSAYILIKVPFNKKEDHRRTVDYVQKVSKLMNKYYLRSLNHYKGDIGNMDKSYNTMDFKSEVVAFKGAFLKKKWYVLGKIWDEGEYFDELKMKKTGGAIAKSDLTPITNELLTKIYKIISLDLDNISYHEMYREIFVELKNSITLKLRKSIQQLDFKMFGIPKKWGMKALKTVTTQVMGAKLYNTLINDVFRPGDSFLMIQIRIDNMPKLKSYLKDCPNFNTDDKYFLNDSNITSKLNTISIPTVLSEDVLTKIKTAFDQTGITLDYDTIMNFNLTLKIDPYLELFKGKVQNAR